MQNNQTGEIIKLPSDVINRIAAGEVIERPAAVVKELVENALDADADKIEVNVEEGGKTYISVKDNGIGISEKDLPMAFEAHATSKLADFKNISEINSFGFRGEALASIASVSKVKITSKKHDADRAFKIESEFGEVGAAKPCVFADGTKIEVIGLFENIPARHKFLKSESTEIA
ncbi:MAG: DNA mismatch repair endonuclease MutL, partial [Planctomycetes bacterium]|nr:DNA mismatch repair endonuclease MutL [Planctomycetota bacterium]